MPTTPRTRAEDAATYYETRGDGRPIVFVHGGWSSSEMWAPQVQSFAAEYRTITYDVRGHGRTTDSGSEPYSIERFVEDLRALIDTLDAEDPILCGLSLGGIIAQTYAATDPEDVGGLVLADTTRWIPPLPISLSGLQKRTLFPKPAVHSYIRAIGVEAYFRQLLAGIQAIEGHQWLALTPEVREFAIREIGAFDVESYLRIFDALYDFGGCDLGAITAPTLVLAGDHEASAVREQSERMATVIEDATLEIVPDAGHLANLDNPSAFDDRIEHFLHERVEQ
jgi:pimeloyl-ACP methyl ester carboxylesterase